MWRALCVEQARSVSTYRYGTLTPRHRSRPRFGPLILSVIPMDYTNTRLWQDCLGDNGRDPTATRESKERLRTIYDSTRSNVSELVSLIVGDLPELTVHDIRHLDALWETGSLVAGSNYTLSPLDAFLFGCALLVHDAAHSVASYEGGMDAIKASTQWEPILKSAFHVDGCEAPTPQEIDDPPRHVLEIALGVYLRENHASQARVLTTQAWKTPSGEERYLIDDPSARSDFGSDIGDLAYSHWLSPEELQHRFNRHRNPPVWAPASGTSDLLTVACLLRTADAIQVDQRRAPRFRRALIHPHGVSAQHWDFQERIDTPSLRENGVYFSGAPFPRDKAASWWLGFDLLQLADRELRAVHAVLTDTGRDPFEAVRVRGVESAQRLAESLPTSGWEPIDTRVTVTSPPALAQALGGVKLNGDQPWIVLRELIQNSSDAIRACRTLGYLAEDAGEIEVALLPTGDTTILQIEDNGIGMTRVVLTEFLVRFAESYWRSSNVRHDHPELLSESFTPTGKHGIGFFSVFMIASTVRVITRHVSSGPADTLVLDFSNGLSARPVLHAADAEDHLKHPGTRIELKLSHDVAERVFSRIDSVHFDTAVKMLAFLCPSLDVDVYFSEEGDRSAVVKANDWLELTAAELCKRLHIDSRSDRDAGHSNSLAHIDHLRDIQHDGRVVARAYVHYDYMSTGGQEAIAAVVTDGGLYASTLMHTAGIFIGSTDSLVRDCGIPVVSEESLRQWATEQAVLLAEKYAEDYSRQSDFAQTVCRFGGDIGCLTLSETAEGWKTLDGIAEWTGKRASVFVVHDASVSLATQPLLHSFEGGIFKMTADDVLPVPMGGAGPVLSGRLGYRGNWPLSDDTPFEDGEQRSVSKAIMRTIARAWKCDAHNLPESESEEFEIGRIGEVVIKVSGTRVSRPAME